MYHAFGSRSDLLRVTVVAPTGVIGDPEIWLLSLLDATDRLAVEAVMLADGPLRDEFTHRRVPCVVRPADNSLAALGGATAWLVHHLHASRPDVLLANGVKAALAGAPAAWLAGVRCVWAKHDHRLNGPLMTLLAAMTDGCVAAESELRDASRHRKATLVPFPVPGRAELLVNHAARGKTGQTQATSRPGPGQCAELLAQALAEAARLPGTGLTATSPVSVVVSVWNEGEAVDRLLGLLCPQLTVEGDEIVVVDDGSTDDTAERAAAWASKDSRVRLLALPHQGVSAARNAAVRAADNSLIACTDAGCDPAHDWLDRLRAAWAEPDPAGLLTAVYRVSGRGVMADAMTLAAYPLPEEACHPGPWMRVYSRFLGRAFDSSLPSGRSMGFTRKAWHDAHGFPEYLATAEDLVFARKAMDAGHRAVLVASAKVTWEQRPTLRQNARMLFRYGQGDGRSGDLRVLGRDLARVAAYAAAMTAVARGPRARAAASAASLAYLSLPIARAVRGHRWAALPAIPLVAAVRDLSKAAGAMHGLACRLVSGHGATYAGDSEAF
jgi:GT2 family glycosyltransferase